LNGTNKSAGIKPDISQYQDIIGLPHHTSEKHPRMPMQDRAAQFSPFAELTGHGDAVRETARLTGSRAELTEGQQERLNMQIALLLEALPEQPEIQVTFFRPDGKKDGGEYETVSGHAKKLDLFAGVLTLAEGRKIQLPDIIEIAGGIFPD